jgi:CO/xanthine dehydrogenase FAD-binding subunit
VIVHAPRRLAEACALLAADPGLVPVAGATDLMVWPEARRLAVQRVLDLGRLAELRGLAETASGLEVGAATTFAELAAAALVRERFPALAAAAATIGGWQIQNRATLGGNLVNASPAGDSLPVLLALEATVVCAGAHGEREVPADEFFVAYRRTALAAGELVARVRLPWPAAGTRQAFRKVGTRQAQAISKVVVAMAVRGGEGRVERLRLAAGSVAPVPVRLAAAEAAAEGLSWEVGARAAGTAAAAAVAPIDDVRSSAAYRREVLARVVRRMVRAAEAAP